MIAAVSIVGPCAEFPQLLQECIAIIKKCCTVPRGGVALILWCHDLYQISFPSACNAGTHNSSAERKAITPRVLIVIQAIYDLPVSMPLLD